MNTERPDFGRALRAWFEDGPTVMNDRVVDDIAVRIARQPQRRTWRLRGRPFVTTYAKLAAGLAAVVLVAVVGWQLLPRPLATAGSSPAPSSRATSEVTAVPALRNGSMAPGTYGLNPLASEPALRILADVPAGWQGYGSFAILGPKGTGSPDGIGIGFVATSGLFRDPCHWDLKGDHSWPQPPDITVGPSVDDLVRALAANKAYTSTAPLDTSLGGFRGKQLELQLPSDIAACDKDSGGSSRYMVFSGVDGGLYAQGPANRFRLTIVDVAGTRLIAVLVDYAATSAADRSVAQEILDSLVITR